MPDVIVTRAPDGVCFVRVPVLAIEVVLWPGRRYVVLWRGAGVGRGPIPRA